MCGIVVSIVGDSSWLVVGSDFMALEIASTGPSGVSRRKDKDHKGTDWGEVGSPAMLSQH